MKLIESKAEYIPQTDLYKHIELCGRTAYKSEDKITEDSAKGFVDRMVKSKHGAVLEHGTVYLIAKVDFTNRDIIDLEDKYITNPYSRVVVTNGVLHITTNYRVIMENNWLDDMKYVCEPTEFHEKRYTIKFTTDRGISHELVRHRKFSFVQESQRYCNYSKVKFNSEIQFLLPSGTSQFAYHLPMTKVYEQAEKTYLDLIKQGCPPQEARAVLPNATKTEVLMTGFSSDWARLFELRLYESTGKVAPDMKVLMQKAWKEFENYGITRDLERYIKL